MKYCYYGQHQPAGVRQRTVRAKEQLLSILEECHKSGYGVKDYIEVSDINEIIFYSWKKNRSKVEDFTDFVIVEIAHSFGARPQLFAEIESIKYYR